MVLVLCLHSLNLSIQLLELSIVPHCQPLQPLLQGMDMLAEQFEPSALCHGRPTSTIRPGIHPADPIPRPLLHLYSSGSHRIYLSSPLYPFPLSTLVTLMLALIFSTPQPLHLFKTIPKDTGRSNR